MVGRSSYEVNCTKPPPLLIGRLSFDVSKSAYTSLSVSCTMGAAAALTSTVSTRQKVGMIGFTFICSLPRSRLLAVLILNIAHRYRFAERFQRVARRHEFMRNIPF